MPLWPSSASLWGPSGRIPARILNNSTSTPNVLQLLPFESTERRAASSPDGGAACAYSGEIVLSHPMSLSPADNFYHPFGYIMQRSYEMAVARINRGGIAKGSNVAGGRCGVSVGGKNYALTLRSYGDGSDGDATEMIAKYIVADPTSHFLLGGYKSTLTKRMAPVANDARALMIAGGSASSSVYDGRDYVFGTLPNSKEKFATLLQLISKAGARSIAVAADPATGACKTLREQSADAGFTSYFEFDVPMNPDDAGGAAYDALFRSLKERIPALDVLFLSCISANAATRIQGALMSLRRVDFSPKAFVGQSLESVTDKYYSAYAMDSYPWYSTRSTVDAVTGWSAMDFAHLFQQNYLVNTSYHGPSAAACVSILVQAIENADSIDPEVVRQELNRTGAYFPTSFANITFNAIGQSEVEFLSLQLELNGFDFRIVSLPEDIVYPMPTWKHRDCISGGQCKWTGGYCAVDGSCNCSEVSSISGVIALGVGGDAHCKELPQAVSNAGLYTAVALGAVMGGTILWALAWALAKRYRAYRRIRQEHERRMEATVDEAVRAMHTLNYPLHLLRGDEFSREGELVRHEVVRDRHMLTVIDSLGDVDAFIDAGNHVVFFSHQWTSSTAPDPSGKQYTSMVAALSDMAQQKGWDPSLRNTFVWVDYSCIPQMNPSLKSLAIQSLAVYSSSATYFIACAPEVMHADLHAVCDLSTYQTRMWCRAEQLCHSMRNGTGNMYLATTPSMPRHADGCPPTVFQRRSVFSKVCAPVSDSFFRQSLRVFDGELTCCRIEHKETGKCDRLSLVVPILGLYGELYRASRDVTKESKGNKINKLLGNIAVEEFLFEIERNMDDIFPRTFQQVTRKKGHRVKEEVVLFGDLIERMRARVKSGAGLVADGEHGTSTASDITRHGSDFLRMTLKSFRTLDLDSRRRRGTL